jgi:putative membrane protein
LAHAIHQYIPSTFVGAPNEETALSVLPAHKLLLAGQGYKAISLAVLGSTGGFLICLALFIPLRFILGPPLDVYKAIQGIMVWILLGIVAIMITTEKRRIPEIKSNKKIAAAAGMLFAFLVFLISGIFGLLIFNLTPQSPVGLPAPVLFPAFVGLFGLPTLLTSLVTQPVIPAQDLQPLTLNPIEKKATVFSVITGSFAGIFVSLIPGLTTATGTIIAMNARARASTEQTIVTLSAVSSAASFFVVIVLFLTLRARSGITIAVTTLLPAEPWSSLSMPPLLAYLLMFLVLSGCVSYFTALYAGRWFAKNFSRIPYIPLVVSTIVFILVLIVLFTGLVGCLITVVATCIGFLPLTWGVRRSQCMGVLLLPIILYFM